MEYYLYIIIIFGVLSILCIGCHCFRLHEQQNKRKQMRHIFEFRRHTNSIDIEFDNTFEETKEEPKLDIIISN